MSVGAVNTLSFDNSLGDSKQNFKLTMLLNYSYIVLTLKFKFNFFYDIQYNTIKTWTRGILYVRLEMLNYRSFIFS